MALKSLLDSVKLKEEIVTLPELGEGAEAIIREMGGKRSVAFYNEVKGKKLSNAEYMLHLIVASFVDEKGNQLHSFDEIPQLHDVLPMSAINKLATACNFVNGFVEKTDAKKNTK